MFVFSFVFHKFRASSGEICVFLLAMGLTTLCVIRGIKAVCLLHWTRPMWEHVPFSLSERTNGGKGEVAIFAACAIASCDCSRSFVGACDCCM